jgi:hypothetical protein
MKGMNLGRCGIWLETSGGKKHRKSHKISEKGDVKKAGVKTS